MSKEPSSTKMPWTPDIEVNAEIVASAVGEQFPEFSGIPPVKIGSGWDNSVWRIGDTAFRFPHRAVGLKFLERERALMPWLGPQLPLPVPFAKYLGEANQHFARPFIGCDFVPGQSADEFELSEADRCAIAPELGNFLGVLHQCSADRALELGASHESRLMNMDTWLQHTLKRIPLLAETELSWTIPIAESVLEVVKAPPEEEQRYVCHGDLYFRHITLDQEHRLAGVIDWGDVGVGDRCSDLEMIFGFFPPNARQGFLKAYHAAGGPHIDDATYQGARAIAASTLLHLGAYALDIKDQKILHEINASARWICQD